MMKAQLLKLLLGYYKRYKQQASNTSLEHCLHVAEKMLKKAKYGFLISKGVNGWSNTRLIQPFIDRESNIQFSLWLGTRKDLRKTEEILSYPKVTLAFDCSDEDASLVIYGNASVETDPVIKKRYWKSMLHMFFPEGPESESYVVVRIKPERIEIINFKRNITPEPFGLKSAVLVNHHGEWRKYE